LENGGVVSGYTHGDKEKKISDYLIECEREKKKK
jgi:hypothetical protein